MKTFNDLTGLYSLSKTLRFELKPVGKTKDNIETKGIIAQDEKRAEEYKKVKDIIDRYHKKFIEMCLANLKLKTISDGNNDSLKEYVTLASKANKDEKEDNDFKDVKTALRKQIVDAFKKGGSYSDLFKKELIQVHLPDFVTDEQEKQMVENFGKFTTYFTGFNENRQNMYSDEEKSTSIAYRLIHENLPMFIDNIKSFAKIAEHEDIDFLPDIENGFKEELKRLKAQSISEVFDLANFTNTLTQSQIDSYNAIIGARHDENGDKVQGINQYVNLYNQKNKDARLPLLKPLYKMILSDRVALSWLPEEFATDEEMLAAINETHGNLKNVMTDVRKLLQNIDSYDTEHIYIANDKGLSDISQQIFGQYDVYTSAIKAELRDSITPSAKERKDPELLEKRINDIFKASKSFSIEYLNSHVDSDKTIQSYYKELGAYDRNGEQRINLLSQIELAYVDAHDVLLGKHTNLNQSEESIKKIKALLDAYKALQHFIKPLLGNGDEADKDNEFDAKLRAIWNELDIITPLYDKVRNRLTRKPYSTEKIKLNFDNAQLLNGWDMNKEPDCTSVLLRKDGQYYLEMTDGVQTWYSEIFTVVQQMSSYLKIEWYNDEDLVFDGGRIVFASPRFHNFLYFATEVGKPEYTFEEEGESRDGFFFPEKQLSEKRYKCTILAPEYLCDVMRLIRMCDHVRVTDKYGRIYDCDQFLITPEWQDQGDLASVEIEFETDTVVKKIGRGYTVPSGADFNNDYNNDYLIQTS